MTATTALEQALTAWNRRWDGSDPDRQVQADDAVALAEWGIFSRRHIEEITGLPYNVVAGLVDKADKRGGRFAAQALPLIHDLWLEYTSMGMVDHGKIKTIVGLGVSPEFLSKLTGLSGRSLARWAK